MTDNEDDKPMQCNICWQILPEYMGSYPSNDGRWVCDDCLDKLYEASEYFDEEF